MWYGIGVEDYGFGTDRWYTTAPGGEGRERFADAASRVKKAGADVGVRQHGHKPSPPVHRRGLQVVEWAASVDRRRPFDDEAGPFVDMKRFLVDEEGVFVHKNFSLVDQKRFLVDRKRFFAVETGPRLAPGSGLGQRSRHNGPKAMLLPLLIALPFHAWAETPPMGWNSWDAFGTGVTEAQTRENAAYMATRLRRHGYDTVTVDIDWFVPGAKGFGYTPGAEIAMDGYGRPLPAPDRFPSAAEGKGFKPLADWTHGKGLRFGVHLLRGIPRKAVEKNLPILGTPYRAADVANRSDVCPWNPDMYGVDMTKPGAQAWYDSMFALLASWGVDYVKVDDLSRPYHQAEIEAIRKAIDRTGRPIVFSTSPGETPLSAGPHVLRHANLWRISDDFWDDWGALKEQFARLDAWTPFRGEGHWPDADMIPLGAVRVGQRDEGSHFTNVEGRTLMTLWSVARSPLILGGHLPKTDPATLDLLTNDEVLGVNRRSANNRQLWRRGDLVAWVADVPGSRDKYVALFNAQDQFRRDDARAAFAARVTRGASARVDLDVTGKTRLWLVADDAGDGFFADHVAWAAPRFDESPATAWVSATQGYGTSHWDRNVMGAPLSLEGQAVRGIGTHANSVVVLDVPAGARRFWATVGIEREGARQRGGGTVRALVFTQDPMVGSPSPTAPVPLALSDLGFKGARVRDLWARRDLGRFEGTFTPALPWHGAGLYRVSP